MTNTDITQEMAREYREVAALVCIDIDLLADIASQSSLTAEELREQIALVRENKDAILRDPQQRHLRYATGCMLWSTVANKANA